MEDMFNIYDSAYILCRKCLEVPEDERDLAAALDRYMESLEPEIRVPADVYARRLEHCAGCPSRWVYTCRECGCYVQVRAAKRGQDCPLPAGEKRWNAAPQDV